MGFDRHVHIDRRDRRLSAILSSGQGFGIRPIAAALLALSTWNASGLRDPDPTRQDLVLPQVRGLVTFPIFLILQSDKVNLRAVKSVALFRVNFIEDK